MPNVLDIEPMRAFVRRISAAITIAKVAARFERLALDRLRHDPRNFRPARPSELAAGPCWVDAALARGEEISVFAPHRGVAARLRTVARRLADTCEIAATDLHKRSKNAASIGEARAFLDKIERVNFDIAARKSLRFSRLHLSALAERDHEPVCPAGEIPATAGRTWRRVTSLAALRAVGREFRNCLARTARSGGSYGDVLLHGEAQFWVLREADAAGLIVAMASVHSPQRFTEVRGPGNARISPEDPDIVCLSEALGMRPCDPPPPPPSAPLAAMMIAWPSLIELNASPAAPLFAHLRQRARAS